MAAGLGFFAGGVRRVFGRSKRREGGGSCSSPPKVIDDANVFSEKLEERSMKIEEQFWKDIDQV
jgi:hypothetical protein